MQIPTDWTFKDKNVADEFDYHVRQQLPWYELATGLVSHCVRHYLPENGLIYDIGCSTGNLELSLEDILEKRSATLIPIDNSPEMVSLYRGKREVVVADAQNYSFEMFDVGVCFLVLMFLSVEERNQLLDKLYRRIKKGGCLILFEKTIADSGYLSTVLHRATIAGKVASGANSDEIIAKELSLGGVQRPLAKHFVRNKIPEAIEIFRFGEFVGWIIERPE
jgi:tRNA (cmo5U34)-methyltransferase